MTTIEMPKGMLTPRLAGPASSSGKLPDSAGGEIVVYPLLEQHLGKQCAKLAEQERTQHQVYILYRVIS
jgi:hypothetical protein